MLQDLMKFQEGKEYSSVRALFLNWERYRFSKDKEENNAYVEEVRQETRRLQSVLRDRYHYDAGQPEDIYNIPSRLSAEDLDHYVSGAILDFAKLQTPKSKLMIVYYNGHGGPGDPKKDGTQGLVISG
jgi:hypothetical protein